MKSQIMDIHIQNFFVRNFLNKRFKKSLIKKFLQFNLYLKIKQDMQTQRYLEIIL